MSRPIRSFLLLTLLCTIAPLAAARPLPIPDPPSFTSHSYVLMDYDSGQLLAAKNPDKRIQPASLTKMMTTYIVFSELKKGNLALDDKVTVSKKAWQMGGSKMFIEVGDKIPVRLLIHGMVTSSGNDATVALAEHIAGSEGAFVTYMNQYAKELGLKNTHYEDASGLPHEQHYMSAHDIALLARALIHDFPDLYQQFFHQKEFTYDGIKQYNRNPLLWSDESVDGLKTGHTEAAGYCLTASAKRDGMRLISVVTGTPSNNARKTSSQALLNYGFRFFETYKLFAADQTVSTMDVWKGASDSVPIGAKGAVYVTAPRGQKDALKTTAALPGRLIAPIAQGQKLGTLKVSYNDKTLRQVPLYAKTKVPEGGIFQRLTDEFLLLFQ